jgi:hypothetical protein
MRRVISELLERRMMMCANDGCVDVYPTPTPVDPGPLIDAVPAGTPVYPLSSVPQLSSRPSATKKLYLDFVGDTIANWGNNLNTGQPYHPGTIPAYTDDGDATTFTQTELNNIQLIWAEVADKFSPFDLDVTTIKPSNTAHGAMFQMDIGGTNAWYGAGGGVAYVGGFTDKSEPNVGFAFSTEEPDSINFIGADCAHEPGHGFGLNHQGSQNSDGSIVEYSNGNATTVPIMGNANNIDNTRGIWFNGLETTVNSSGGAISSGASQDDLSIISNSTNGFGYRADDWTISNYTMMQFDTTGTLDAGYGGVIENTGDDDPFGFQATGTTATFTIGEPTQFGMLAPAAVIETPQQSVVATSTNNNISCTVTATNLVPGNIYLLDVRSQGGYGDIGSYQISGSIKSFAFQSGFVLNVPGFSGLANNLTISDSGGNYVLTDATTGGAATLSFPTGGILNINISLGSLNDTVDLGGGSLAGFTGVTIDTGAGNDSVVLDDSSSTAVATYHFADQGTTGEYFYLNSGNGVQFVLSVESVTLKTSNASGDSVLVAGTVVPTSVIGDGSETLDVGVGNMQSIDAPVSDSNPPAYTQVTLDDSSDTVPRFASFSGTSITGLSPATVSWTASDTSLLTLDGGSGGNTFNSSGTATNYTTTVNLGAGNDRFQDLGAGAGTFQINGQGGFNTAQFFDTAATAALAYNFSSGGFTRAGLTAFVDAGVQTLQLSLGSGGSVVTIPALPVSTAVSIVGTTPATDTYNIGTGSHLIPSMTAGLDVEDLIGVGTITLDDSARAVYSTTTITGTTWSSNTTAGQLTYTIRHLVYDTSNASSLTYFNSTAGNTTYQVKGGAGTDLLDVGAGNLSNISGLANAGGITFDGGAGFNQVTVDDSNDTAAETYNLSSSGVTLPGLLTVGVTANVSSLQIFGGRGNDTVNVPTTPLSVPVTILPGGGVNAVTVEDADNLNSLVTVNGSSGTTTFTYIDNNDGSYQVSAGAVGERVLSLDTSDVLYNSIAGLTVNVNNGGSGQTFNVSGTAAGTPVTVNQGSGTVTLNVNQTSPTGPVTVYPSSGNDPLNVDAPGIGTGPASVIYSQPQQTGLLNIGSAGLVTISSATKMALFSTGLAVTGNGTIDLTTDDFGLLTGSLSTITALARTGYNLAGGGRWNGPGITSSAAASDTTHLTAVAVVQNNQSGTPLYSGSRTFDGGSPGAAAILAKYTYFGDANLDGKVDGSDYTLIDAGYASMKSGSRLTGWYNGDFNYDGVIDGSDYALIDNAFNNQRAAIPSAAAATPTSITAKPAAVTAAAKPAESAPARAVAIASAFTVRPAPSWPIPPAAATDDALDRLKMRKAKSR